jgi:hypothetical protein
VKRTRGGRERVELPFSFASNVDELGIAQNGQVARNLRLEFTEDLAQVTNADFLLRLEEIQNPETCRIGESAEEVGRSYIHKTEYEWNANVCQADGMALVMLAPAKKRRGYCLK